MKYQMIFLLCFGIRNTFQDDHLCYNKTTVRRDVCCNNYEWSEGKCNKCKIGTTTEAGGRCLSCQNDFYGEKCAQKCRCDETERCDAKVGCIPNTNSTTTNITETNLHASSNGSDSAKAGTVTKNEHSINEWIVYTLCITGFTILLGVANLFHKYRKRRSLNPRIKNEVVCLKSLKPTPYVGTYDAVDENPLTFDIPEDVEMQASSMQNSTFMLQGRPSITTDIEDDATTGYLDLYFPIEKGNTHGVQKSPHKERLSNKSSNSGVVGPDDTEFSKSCTILQENAKEDLNECEITITVHQCNESSSISEEKAPINTTQSSTWHSSIYK